MTNHYHQAIASPQYMVKYNTQNYGQIEYESYKGFQIMVQSLNSPKFTSHKKARKVSVTETQNSHRINNSI